MADDKDSNSEDEHSGDGSLAADDPTAVWDSNSIRDAGLDEVLDKRDSVPSGPATEGAATDSPKVIIQNAPAHPESPAAAQARSGNSDSQMGWGATITLALGLGAVVYFAVRFLK